MEFFFEKSEKAEKNKLQKYWGSMVKMTEWKSFGKSVKNDLDCTICNNNKCIEVFPAQMAEKFRWFL